MSDKVSGQLLWDFCQELVNQKAGYVWGARGRMYDEAEASYLYKSYKSGTYNEKYYFTTSMARWKGRIVVDCSGMIQAFRIKYLDGKDDTANGLYNKCDKKGTINTLPDNARGILLFNQGSNERMGHVGVYGGDGTTIEAYSSSKGVIKTKPMNKSAWTHWGIPNWIEPTIIEEIFIEPYVVANCSAVNVRTGAGTAFSIKKALKKNTLVHVYDIDGNWAKISASESLWVSMSYLKKIQKATVSGCTSLHVRNKPNALGKSIGYISKGTIVYKYATMVNGWVKISPIEERYVSGKYLK